MKTLFVAILAIVSSTLYAQENLALTTTIGSATEYAVPDEALVSFSVITYDNDIQMAKEKNAKISKNTIAYLKNMNVDEKHIQTQYLNIGKNYRHDRNPEREKKFVATQQFSVCITNLSQLETVMTDLLGLEIANLSTPQFRTTKLEEYKLSAMKKAVLNAKQKAELLSSTLGQKIGKAFQINEVGHGSPVVFKAYDRMEASAGNQGGDSFAVGQLEIKMQVEVSFLLN